MVNKMISIKIIENKNNLHYDLNGICENADSIYWTLVPNEVFAIYQSNSYILTSQTKSGNIAKCVNWW